MTTIFSKFPPLEEVTSPNVPTSQAAHYLGRRPQTLRIWAMGRSDVPIRPLNIGGRLAWPVARLREVCGVPR
jgi:hypothetical protein